MSDDNHHLSIGDALVVIFSNPLVWGCLLLIAVAFVAGSRP